MNDTDLAAVAAAIDSTDTETQCSVIPKGAAGRFHLIVAVRAAQRARGITAEAIALAAEGRITEALEYADDVHYELDAMRTALATARDAGVKR